LDAGYVAHPSFVTSEELLAITNPLSIAAAGESYPFDHRLHYRNWTDRSEEIDNIFTRDKRSQSEQILAEIKVPYQINLYGSVSHGFAVKGDLSIKDVKFATDQAFEQAVTWFKHWI
jgi:dienelactone hydrolase